MSENIKPCPFCGKEVSLRYKHGDYGYTTDTVSVKCDVCEIGFWAEAEKWERGRGHYSVRDEAEKKLIAKWNGRFNAEQECVISIGNATVVQRSALVILMYDTSDEAEEMYYKLVERGGQ